MQPKVIMYQGIVRSSFILKCKFANLAHIVITQSPEAYAYVLNTSAF